ncbi:unnamed protein product [Gordionus sp. m RMFG-2023]
MEITEFSDQLSKGMAIFSLLPTIILSGLMALILLRRDLHTAIFFIGNFLNCYISFFLKKYFKSPRPFRDSQNMMTFGMPSSHSQFAWFFSIYMILFIYIRISFNNQNSPQTNPLKIQIIRLLISTFLVVLALLISYSRIYLLYHTPNQVLVGGILGFFLGLSWFILVQYILTPYFSYVCSWPICEMLLIRDYTLIPNIIFFEYQAARCESNSRQRKIIKIKSQ